MSDCETETEESGWTNANLQKLLAAMKTSIPKEDRGQAYTRGLKAMDWKTVAFPPFSPEACQEKWGEILQKMRKTRSLTELIVEAEDAISNPVKRKKIHPEIPKRPCPPNAIFYEENCAKFHQKHPKMTSPHLLSLLNQKYKALSDEDKVQYEEKHWLERKEYNRQMEEFREQNHLPSQRKRTAKRKREGVSVDTPESKKRTEDADGLPPKPPFNGYNLFCKEQLGSMAGVSKDSYLKVWAQRWRDLTKIQRDEYSARCTKLKRQYSVKLNEFLMTLDEEEQQRILKKHGIKRPKIIKRETKPSKKLPGEPQMPPRASNLIFFKDQMEHLKKKFPNSRERFIKVSQIWKDLSNEKKEGYREMVKEKFMKYTMELQKWFQTLSPKEQEDYLRHNPTKCKYLNDGKMKVIERKEVLYRPSDSEDEDIEDSSSDEEEDNLNCEEDEEEEEEEEEEGDIMFEMY